MFERLRLVNFQKHKDIRIVFAAPGVTTIVGPSDRGKSAIIRALRWLLQNRPTNSRMRRRGKDNATIDADCVVTLWVDGRKVTRSRGEKVNSYTLDDKEYNALGRDVPPPIAQLGNMGEANFQRQLDQPYWFTESGPQVATKLNAIVNLEIIDSVLDSLSGKVRHARAAVSVAQERYDAALAAKEALAFVKPLMAELGSLEDAYAKYNEAEDRIALLGALCQLAQQARDAAGILARCATAGAKVVQRGVAATQAQHRAAALRTRVETAAVAAQIKQLPKYTINKLKAAKDTHKSVTDKVTQLRAAIKTAATSRSYASSISSRVGDAKDALYNYTRDMEVCPVCQKPLQ